MVYVSACYRPAKLLHHFCGVKLKALSSTLGLETPGLPSIVIFWGLVDKSKFWGAEHFKFDCCELTTKFVRQQNRLLRCWERGRSYECISESPPDPRKALPSNGGFLLYRSFDHGAKPACEQGQLHIEWTKSMSLQKISTSPLFSFVFFCPFFQILVCTDPVVSCPSCQGLEPDANLLHIHPP